MQILLEGKELPNIVLGVKVKPARDFADLEKRDRKARTFIVMGLHDSLLYNVIGAKMSKETWDCLLKVYKTKGLANKLFF
jgi:hypothetical protein